MDYLLLGLTLGFAAGISPGPLLSLVMAATLERGFAAGVRVSLAPALTDAPIIAIVMFALKDLPPVWLQGISVIGGLFILAIGLSTIRKATGQLSREGGSAERSADLWRGMLVNLLNPSPWLFWATVGGPILIRSWEISPAHSGGFLASFYLLIVGSKICAAALVAKGREFLQGAWYRRTLAGSGLLLIALGGLLVWQGLVGV